MSAEAEETDLPPGEGFRFVVYGERVAEPKEVLGRLRRVVRREVARAYLEPAEGGVGVGGTRWSIAGAEVAGRMDWSGHDADLSPSVVVDGRRLTWEELGRLVASFQGWGFSMRFGDSSDGFDGGVDDAVEEGDGGGRTEAVPGLDDGADAEVVPLFGTRGSGGEGPPMGRSIDDALAGFLADQQERLAASTFARYEDIVDLLRLCLNGYGHTSLSSRDAQAWQEAYDAGDEDAFTRSFGPERIVEGYGGFLGYFMVRKVAASKQQLKDAGTVTKRLARWLAEQGYVDADAAEAARGTGACTSAASGRPRCRPRPAMLPRSAGTSPSCSRGSTACGDSWRSGRSTRDPDLRDASGSEERTAPPAR